ncbi:MAG: heparinase II/III family protein [Pseudohaliea sp.]
MRRLLYHLRVSPADYLFRQALQRWPSAKIAVPRMPRSLQPAEPADFPGDLADSIRRAANPPAPEALACRIAALLEHRFDVLGSGWLRAGYGDESPGLEGHRYAQSAPLDTDPVDGSWLAAVVGADQLAASRAAWARAMAIAPGYRPVDWQRDLVSGFRWSARVDARRQFRLHRGRPGADPVRPMELGRLLHLTELAACACMGRASAGQLATEYQAQVLDFAAANPPGMGIQWSCALDVGVRTANLAMSYWLFNAIDGGALLDDDFRRRLAAQLWEHGHFLRRNLEWNGGNTGNHYLGGLVGLLFAAVFFRGSAPAGEWAAHVFGALDRELSRQFLPDGGHFEGSSTYHAFCTELLLWSLPLAVRAGADRSLQDRIGAVVGRALGLVKALRTPRGDLPQFGDCDSAHLFRFLPRGELSTRRRAADRYLHLRHHGDADDTPFFDENTLDFSDLTDTVRDGTVPNLCFRALAGAERAPALLEAMAPPTAPCAGSVPQRVAHGFAALAYALETHFGSPADLLDGLAWSVFEDSGLYIARSPALYLVLTAACSSQLKHNLSHSHNDRLGVELYFGTAPRLRDPGTYQYTALRKRRDDFRRTRAHNVPRVAGFEQNRFVDTFISYPDVRCELLQLEPRRLRVRASYRAIVQEREVEIGHRQVTIRDYCNRPFEQAWNASGEYSPGYGKLRVNDL